jgi:hypothetical protein
MNAADWDGDSEVGLAEQWLRRFDKELAPLTPSWLPTTYTPRQFLDKTRVPHVAVFCFGEQLPVLTHSLTEVSLPGIFYDTVARLLHSKPADIGWIRLIIKTSRESGGVHGITVKAMHMQAGAPIGSRIGPVTWRPRSCRKQSWVLVVTRAATSK